MAISYKITLGIGFHGATHSDTVTVDEMGYTDEEWNDLTDAEKDNELNDIWTDWSNNYIEGGWEKT